MWIVNEITHRNIVICRIICFSKFIDNIIQINYQTVWWIVLCLDCVGWSYNFQILDQSITTIFQLCSSII